MFRGVTKDVNVFTLDIRSFPVIETTWSKYPYYYEIISPMVVKANEQMVSLVKGDYLVWDSKDNMLVFKSKDWQNAYGKFLKEKMKGEHKLEKKT